MLKVSLFGSFSIQFNETPIPNINTPRLQSLLAYLMLHSNAPQSRAYMASLFWPDTSENQARTNLRNLLHNLKQALPEPDEYILVDSHTIQWRQESRFVLDVTEFLSALTHAESLPQDENSPVVHRLLERAISLYKGDLLPGCYEEWIIPLREELRLSYLSAIERMVRLLEELGDYPGAIRHAQSGLWVDPLNETAYQTLMRLYALNGDRASALRVFHTCTTVLQRELDVEPSVETCQIYKKILGAEIQPAVAFPVAAIPHTVGRTREWVQILNTWRNVATRGGPRILILSGEAGIGKTRIIEDMLQWTNRQAITTASAWCYAAEGNLAYAPVAVWLRANPLAEIGDPWIVELARLLPEILSKRPDLPQPVALTEPWLRLRFFEALSRAVLAVSQPLLLTIDDLQWCDRDTLEWLHFLLRFDRYARLLIIGSYRTEEIDEFHPLVGLLQSLQLSGQVIEIELGPLDEDDTRALATQLAGEEISREKTSKLYKLTEGNPLFVVEMMRAGMPDREEPWLVPGNQAGHVQNPDIENHWLPPRVKSIMQARLAQLSPSGRELAGVAATIGREFGFKLLEKICDLPRDSLVNQLDELWRHRIIREHGAEEYDFTHDCLRDVAYTGLSAARRRTLHLEIARALVSFHDGNLDPVSYRVAVHFEQAGEAHLAVLYYLQAAKMAGQVLANDEAAAILKHAVTLLPTTGSGWDSDTWKDVSRQLFENLGDVLESSAQHDQALSAYQSALNAIPPEETLARARIHRKMAIALKEKRNYEQALKNCMQAEILLGEQPDDNSLEWWDEWLDVQVEIAWSYYWLAHWLEMDAVMKKAQPIVEARGSKAYRVRFLWVSCLMYLRKDRYVVSDAMLANSVEARNLSRELGDYKYILTCQFELGFLYLWRRDLGEAEQNLLVALGLAEKYGVLPIRTLCLTYLTILYRFNKEISKVDEFAGKAYHAAEAAQMPDYIAASLGNQAWLAWVRRDLCRAEQCGNEALAIWRNSPLRYPFQWQALWPLVGAAWENQRMDALWEYVADLLEPKQQCLPAELDEALRAVMQGKSEGRRRDALLSLEKALKIAGEMGYL